ncbi:MAG: DUF2071 domain-containing protein [Chloroflexota bacterium]|nr:DUF2071 domain-containing protein [Chloroflexota bacterium]
MAVTGGQPGRPFLTAEWRDLAIVNFEVDPEMLERFVPNGTELSLWRDRCFVSLVAFRFLNTRLLGVPVPFHRDFEEMNLRFYVSRTVGDELRRGVVFIKEIVPKRAVTLVARAVYNENYHTVRMRHEVRSGFARYEWRAGRRWSNLAVQASGPARIPDVDSETSFVAEHHWGYVIQRDGATVEYRVERPRWRVAPASVVSWQVDARSMYGDVFAASLDRDPASVFLAEGSAVSVGRSRRLQP